MFQDEGTVIYFFHLLGSFHFRDFITATKKCEHVRKLADRFIHSGTVTLRLLVLFTWDGLCNL